jgi:hypothetical protein
MGTLAEYGTRSIPFKDNNNDGAVIPCGGFDGLGMLQQNKGGSSLCGPVAQLGARFHGMEEVTGSIPVRFDPDHVHQSFQTFSSTSFPDPCRILVANSKTLPRG